MSSSCPVGHAEPAKAASAVKWGMDRWASQHPTLWLERELPVGALHLRYSRFARGRPWSAAAERAALRRLAVSAGVRRRFAAHQLRHAHAVEMAREGVPLNVIQRQLGHANLGITSVCLQGIDNSDIIETVHRRPANASRQRRTSLPVVAQRSSVAGRSAGRQAKAALGGLGSAAAALHRSDSCLPSGLPSGRGALRVASRWRSRSFALGRLGGARRGGHPTVGASARW
jgi:hypothetical protein